MLVAEALNTDTRVLEITDSVSTALQKVEELQVDRLPVIENESRELVGQISLRAIQNIAADTPHRLMGDIHLEKATALFSDQHLFHAVQLMLQHEMSLLPVINEERIYQGVIEKHHVLELLGQMLNLTGYGSVITIELNQQNFTLSEIVQLIETEGGKILGITVEVPDGERQAYEVSIKLNLQDVSRIASSLRRYGYRILTEAKSVSNTIDLETRADEFLKYLNI